MRVLWFSVTRSLYSDGQQGGNGGGWIASLEKVIREQTDIELGIAFELTNSTFFKKVRGSVTYYPFDVWTSIKRKLEKKLTLKAEDKYIIPECLKIIEDFKPDLIQVFGTEWCFGLIGKYTSIPVVIHMQGCIPPCYNARFPVGFNEYDFIFGKGLSLKSRIQLYKANFAFEKRSQRDIDILHSCRYYLGRTTWDKAIVNLYNPKATYYYCNEVLRDVFYSVNQYWKYGEASCIEIVSTLSLPWYKGVDVVLKTAKLLKENSSIQFRWRIFGTNNICFYEKKLGISAKDVNVCVMGVVSADQLMTELIHCSFYVHPSYIDNSPNSVCEAQILGVPIIATNVGGVSSLIRHEYNGLLVPANDPFMIAEYIVEYHNDVIRLNQLSKNAIESAQRRHDKKNILKDLLFAYNDILEHEKRNS